MQSDADHGQPSSNSQYRHALRVYGACCIGGNLLVLSKGLALHDPLIIASGATGAAGQLANAVFGNSVKRYSVPALIVAASLFGAAGIRSHHAAHIVFGGVKDLGLATMFYGCRIPALRMVRTLRPELVGEGLLAVATSALAYDGIEQLVEGVTTGSTPKIVNGAITICAAAGFFTGQRYASKLQKHERLGLLRPCASGFVASYGAE